MAVLSPKNIDIPPIEPLDIPDDVKRWLRQFSDNLAFFLRNIRSDAVETTDGLTQYFGPSTKNGSWRIRNDGTDLYFEVQIGAAWIRKLKLTQIRT